MLRSGKPKPVFAVRILAVAVLFWASGTVSGQVPPDEDRDRIGRELAGRLGAAYAPEIALDRALAERARERGVTASAADLRLEEEYARGRAARALAVPLEDAAARLSMAGVPRGVLAEAIAHRARERALAAAIVKAERPAPTEAEIAAAFERAYGPGGVKRVYRQAVVGLDPLATRAYGPEDAARDAPAVREAARAAATRLAADIAAGRATIADAPVRGGELVPLGENDARIDPASRRKLASSPPGTPVSGEAPNAAWVAVVTRHVEAARLEGVKMAILPRPGEADADVRRRAAVAATELARAPDPALYALRSSDDEEDRRSGGVFEVASDEPGSARRPAPPPPHEPGVGPPPPGSTAPGPVLAPGVLEALADLAPGAATPPIPAGRGYAIALLVKREPLGGPTRDEGRVALFRSDEQAIRMAVLGPKMAALAAARAESIRARAAAGESLAALSAAESDPPWGDKGGLVERFPTSAGEDFLRAARALAPGAPPVVLRSGLGFHVIACERETATRLEDVRAKVVEDIRERVASEDEIDGLLRELGRVK